MSWLCDFKKDGVTVETQTVKFGKKYSMNQAVDNMAKHVKEKGYDGYWLYPRAIAHYINK